MTTVVQKFLPSRLRSNPLVLRTLRQPSNLHIVWRVIAIISLLSLIGALFFKDSVLFASLSVLGLLMLVVNPLFGAMTAANLICHTIKAEQYEFIILTTLSDMKLVEGHIFGVYYRLRIPLVLTLGLIPSVLIRLTDTAYASYNFCTRYSRSCQAPATSTVVGQFFVYCAFVFAAIALLVFGIALSATLSLWWRNRYTAGNIAMVTMVILPIMLFSLPNNRLVDNDPIAIFIPTMLYALLIAALAICIMIAAQVVARRRP